MAIKLSSASQLNLFEHLFGPGSEEVATANQIIADGGLFDVTMFMVKAVYKGKTYSQTLTVSTTSLLSGSVSALLKQQACFMLKTFIFSIKPPEALPEFLSAKTPAKVTEVHFEKGSDNPATVSYAGGVEPAVKAATTTAQFVQSIAKGGPVIKLREATQLGQKVEGTSSGSVYRVVALNDRIKIATKLGQHEASLRVEFKNPTAAEKVALDTVFNMKSGYGSVHVSSGPVPVSRVVGAMLFSLSGIEFTQLVHGMKQLEEANA